MPRMWNFTVFSLPRLSRLRLAPQRDRQPSSQLLSLGAGSVVNFRPEWRKRRARRLG